MKRMTWVSALLAAAIGGGSATGADEYPYLASANAISRGRTCARVKDVAPPARDRPSAAEARRLADCDSEALLFGIGRTADPVLARKCAFVELTRPNSGGPRGFEGSGILTTVYANGSGTPVNLDLAQHYACAMSEETAQAEVEIRTAHLEWRRTHRESKPFDLCDDITSGLWGGICAFHHARINDDRRFKAYAAITRPWTTPQRAAYRKMMAAEKAYVEAYSAELGRDGTAALGMAIDDQQALRQVNFETLQRLGRPSLWKVL